MATLDLELDPLPDNPRVGKDELNLAEFPFAMLHTRPPKNAPLTLEFRDGEKEWQVTGDPNYGLPMASDIEVYVILMELTREQNFPVQVEFSRSDLIRRLGWDRSGQYYDRLVLSLNRLVGVTIRTKNAFYDAKQKKWERSKAFHILEEYDLTEKKSDPDAQHPLFPNWFRWSAQIYANMQSGYIKSLDVGLFLSLKSAISQALYRYLDKKRYDGKPVYRIALKTLAFEHLGMSRTYFPSEAKHKLKRAHEELVEIGFLSRVEYAQLKGSGDDMVVYYFGETKQRQRALAPPPPNPLAEELVKHGVSRKDAAEFAESAADEAQRQLEYLPYREARDPGAVLVKSIREGWSVPPAYLQAQAKQQRAESRKRQAETKQAETKQAGAEQAGAEKNGGEAAFDTWWAAQAEAQQTAWTAAAEALLRTENQTLAELGKKNPRSVMYREGLRGYLKRVSGYCSS